MAYLLVGVTLNTVLVDCLNVGVLAAFFDGLLGPGLGNFFAGLFVGDMASLVDSIPEIKMQLDVGSEPTLWFAHE